MIGGTIIPAESGTGKAEAANWIHRVFRMFIINWNNLPVRFREAALTRSGLQTPGSAVPRTPGHFSGKRYTKRRCPRSHKNAIICRMPSASSQVMDGRPGRRSATATTGSDDCPRSADQGVVGIGMQNQPINASVSKFPEHFLRRIGHTAHYGEASPGHGFRSFFATHRQWFQESRFERRSCGLCTIR